MCASMQDSTPLKRGGVALRHQEQWLGRSTDADFVVVVEDDLPGQTNKQANKQ